jgi:WD40 repeat protein
LSSNVLPDSSVCTIKALLLPIPPSSGETVVAQPVSSSTTDAKISILERRLRLLIRLNITLFAVIALVTLSAFSSKDFPRAGSTASDSVLVLRALSIVDDRGVERVRIAAPLPDPIMLGRRFSRGEHVSGMMIYDSEGNERGGYITDESRNAALTLDEINRAAVHIGTSDRGEAHVSLSNGRGGYALFGMRPTGTFMAIDGKKVVTSADTQTVAAAQPIATAPIAAEKPLAVLTRHRAGISSTRFSPDGRTLASADLQGAIILWRTADWHPIRTLEHGSEVYAVAFSPDGNMLASTGADSTAVLWNLNTGTKERRLRYNQRALAVVFASNGDLLVGTEDGVVHFVNPALGTELRTLRTGGSIWSIAVSADGSALATGLPLRLWDYKTLALKAKAPSLAQLGVAFSADGSRLASAESTGGALLWTVGDSLTYTPLRLTMEKKASGPRGFESFPVNMPAASIDMSRDGTRIATGATTSDVYLWSVPRAAEPAASLVRVAGHSMSVTAIALSPNGALVASGSLDRTLKIWRWPTP